jgi:hypothetical protein
MNISVFSGPAGDSSALAKGSGKIMWALFYVLSALVVSLRKLCSGVYNSYGRKPKRTLRFLYVFFLLALKNK